MSSLTAQKYRSLSPIFKICTQTIHAVTKILFPAGVGQLILCLRRHKGIWINNIMLMSRLLHCYVYFCFQNSLQLFKLMLHWIQTANSRFLHLNECTHDQHNSLSIGSLIRYLDRHHDTVKIRIYGNCWQPCFNGFNKKCTCKTLIITVTHNYRDEKWSFLMIHYSVPPPLSVSLNRHSCAHHSLCVEQEVCVDWQVCRLRTMPQLEMRTWKCLFKAHKSIIPETHTLAHTHNTIYSSW